MTKTARFHELLVTIPDEWSEAEEAEGDGPLTLIREDGVGALQFSAAVYEAGEEPRITRNDLRQMLETFAEQHSFTSGRDRTEEDGPSIIVAATYEDGPDCIRIWFISDTLNAALATYVCDCREWNKEVEECEKIVRSVRFVTK